MRAVAKSYEDSSNPITNYCTQLTVRQQSVQRELHEATLSKSESSQMLGAPEVLQLGQNFLELIGAKRVLDIGTFTGASALAWAISIPSDGRVLSMDVSHQALHEIGLPIIEKQTELRKKIDFRLGTALDILDELIVNGESGTWDFAFVDADKQSYPEYYEKAVTLLRKGGVILIDNALWDGTVVAPPDDKARVIDATNRKIFDDPRTSSILINIGDGLHIAFKR